MTESTSENEVQRLEKPRAGQDMIGKTGTAYLYMADLIELSILRVAEIRRRQKLTGHRDINIDERIILYLADELHTALHKLDELGGDVIYDRLAEIADANERRALAAEIELRDIYAMMQARGMKGTKQWRKYLDKYLPSPPP